MLFRPLHPVPTLSVRSFVRQSGLFASLSIDKEREREEGGGNDQLRQRGRSLLLLLRGLQRADDSLSLH